MQKETVTFDKLPEAVGYLTEQVIELKKMVAELQPPASDKHVLVEIEDACRIIRKAKPTIYTLVRKGLLPDVEQFTNTCSSGSHEPHNEIPLLITISFKLGFEKFVIGIADYIFQKVLLLYLYELHFQFILLSEL